MNHKKLNVRLNWSFILSETKSPNYCSRDTIIDTGRLSLNLQIPNKWHVATAEIALIYFKLASSVFSGNI
jgi:hypothetical protein